MLKYVFRLLLITVISLSVANAESIKIGTRINYEPFDYFSIDFKIIGFEPDLIAEISNRVGFEYEFVIMEYAELMPALLSGQIDMISSAMSITTEALDVMAFTNPYYNSRNAYMKMKSRSDITNKEDLKGKSIGIIEGSEQERIASEIENAKVLSVKNFYTATIYLENNQIDAILVDEGVADYFIEKSMYKEVFLTEDYINAGFGFAVRKDADSEFLNAINMALNELMLDGTYGRLLEKYKLTKGKI